MHARSNLADMQFVKHDADSCFYTPEVVELVKQPSSGSATCLSKPLITGPRRRRALESSVTDTRPVMVVLRNLVWNLPADDRAVKRWKVNYCQLRSARGDCAKGAIESPCQCLVPPPGRPFTWLALEVGPCRPVTTSAFITLTAG